MIEFGLLETTQKELNEMQAKLNKEAEAKGATAIKQGLVEFFKKFPQVEKVQWMQCTPYFNDGDPCVFGVHDVRVKLKDAPKDIGDYEDGYIGSYDLKYYHEKGQITPPEGLSEALSSIDSKFSSMEKVLEVAFGDHMRITVTPTELTTEEYEHD